jgi:hypothetical protein
MMRAFVFKIDEDTINVSIRAESEDGSIIGDLFDSIKRGSELFGVSFDDVMEATKLGYIDIGEEPEPEPVEKHLPGKHDQSTHGRRGFLNGNDPKHLEAFIKARSKVSQKFLSPYTVEMLIEHKARVFLSRDKKSGYCVTPEGDLQNVFSLNHRGTYAVKDAVKNGASTLDCFEPLLGFYQKFGFAEYRREDNWTPGGPKVIFMKVGIEKKKKGQVQPKETWDELTRRLRQETIDSWLASGHTYEELEDAILDMMGPMPPDMK